MNEKYVIRMHEIQTRTGICILAGCIKRSFVLYIVQLQMQGTSISLEGVLRSLGSAVIGTHLSGIVIILIILKINDICK